MMKVFSRVYRVLLLIVGVQLAFTPGRAGAQTIPKYCDFWGTATIRGVAITSSSTVRAYDPRGQLCGVGSGSAGGYYSVSVANAYDGSPYPGGASDGETITFRIDGELAVVVGGSAVWQEGSKQCNLEVPDVPPTADVGGPYTGSEGTAVTFDGSGSEGTATYSWNFGDGSTGSGVSPTHVYTDNGVYTVTLTLTNTAGSDVETTTATIANVAPTVNAGSNKTSNEGSSVSFSGSFTDPGSADTHTFEWDLDNDGSYDDHVGQYPTMTYDAEGTHTIAVRVTDDDGGQDTDQTTVTVITGVEVTVTTTPLAGLRIHVNGQVYTAPYTETLNPGQQITLEAPWDQYTETGIRYHYLGWTEGGSRIKTVTIPSQPVTYTARYVKQYYVDIDTRGVDAATVGEGWYEPGVNVDIQVEAEVLGSGGQSRYRFASWSGDGNGSYDGTDRLARIQVWGPITQHVNWDAEYYLDVATAYGTATGSGWYEPGQQVQISVTTAVDAGEGTRRAFQGWTGAGSGSYTGPANPATITMNGPVTQTAVWHTEYRVDVESEYGNPTGSGWYAAGSTAQIFVDSAVEAGTGTRVAFKRWLGVGNGAYTGTNASFSLAVLGPVVETAEWRVEHYLDIVSDRGNPQGEGWYEEGRLVTISVDSTTAVSQGVRYRFDGWTGTGQGGYTGDDRTTSVVLSGPLVQEAAWQLQFYVTTDVTPEGSGTINEFPPPGGWGDANTSVKLTAVGDGEQNYGFLQWQGDASGSVNPLSMLLNAPKSVIAEFTQVQVRIISEPAGLTLNIDGLDQVSPVVTEWAVGTTHTLAAPSPQGDEIQKRFTFQSWSDGGAASHQVTIPTAIVTYTALYDASYYLTVASDYGQTQGQGWYAKGVQATISVDSLVYEGDQIRRRFTGWTGTGSGSVTTTQREIILEVNGPITQRAQWTHEFKLDVALVPPNVSDIHVEMDPPGPWYAPGTSVRLTAVTERPDFSFTSWGGDVEGEAETVNLVVQGPMLVTANFYVPNLPPEITAFPTLRLIEDEVFERSFDWLAQYVKDANNSIDELDLSFDGGAHLTVTVDTENRRVRMVPEANWSGSLTLSVTATDPFGLQAAAQVPVQVASVDDAPTAFALIDPPNDSYMTEWSWITEFSWHPSYNVDPDDSVTYNFYLSPNPNLVGDGTLAVTFLADTTLLLNMRTDGTYYWAVWAEDRQKQRTRCDEVFKIVLSTTAVQEIEAQRPQAFTLMQNYPNPFNPETTIRYALPSPSAVKLTVFDVMGRRVAELFDGAALAGTYEAVWDGRDGSGRPVASGLYLVRIEADGFVDQKKMLLLR